MSDTSLSQQPSLAQYGKKFQEGFVQALLVDQKFAENMLEVFNVEYLDLKYLQFLTQRYFDYSKKYRVFPSLIMLITIIKDELKQGLGSDSVLKEQIVDYLQRMRKNDDLGDLPYIKEKSLEFCRKQALKKALENAVDQMLANKYEAIVDNIKSAIMVGTAPSVGHDFFTDYDARFTTLARDAISTGMPQLDKRDIFNGGWGKGELCVVMAPSGVGKSHFLVASGCNALRQGKNVIHYTFELSEAATGVRYDSNLCDIDSTNVIDNKTEILKMYENMPELGRLIIKYEPMNYATVYTLRAHLERLALKGFRPDIIIIDYADKMRSTRQYEQIRLEHTLIYEELRVLAAEMNVPVLTAAQSNKEGAGQDVIDMTSMSESYGKAQTSDIIISISRRTHEKSTGIGRIYIAKNRAGRDGIVYPVLIDTARSKFEIRGEEMNPSDVTAEVEVDLKKKLRQSWDQVKNDKALQLSSVDPGRADS